MLMGTCSAICIACLFKKFTFLFKCSGIKTMFSLLVYDTHKTNHTCKDAHDMQTTCEYIYMRVCV